MGRLLLLMLWGEKRKQLAGEEPACQRGEASGKLEPMNSQDDLVRAQQETIRLQQVQIESLQKMVASLQELIASLQEELARPGPLSQEVVSLREQVEELSQENQRLQDRSNKNSSNSRLPPSSDRFARQKRSLREKSGKKVGGQPGHPGQTLCMQQEPDEVLIHAVTRCQQCQADLEQVESLQQERRQVIHLPLKRTVVIEHRTESKCCPHCGTLTQAAFPHDVQAPIQYGSDIAAVGVYLIQDKLLPYERASELLSDLLGWPIGVAALSRWSERCAKHLGEVEEQIKQALREAGVLHHDETGFYVKGERWWMHTTSTKLLTHYTVHRKRGRAALEAIAILAHFHGTSIHDGLSSYWTYSCLHGLCNVHHLRELKYQAEEKQQSWARDLIGVLLEMKQAVQQAKEAGLTCLPAEQRGRLVTSYQAALTAGYTANPPEPPPRVLKRGRRAQSQARNLLDRLCNHQDAVLRFLDDFAVPFDNHLAEQDLRMVKVQQKVSGCFRREQGAQAFARIRGYISTLRKQGMQVLSALEMALLGHAISPAF
jgi:transposase